MPKKDTLYYILMHDTYYSTGLYWSRAYENIENVHVKLKSIELAIKAMETNNRYFLFLLHWANGFFSLWQKVSGYWLCNLVLF